MKSFYKSLKIKIPSYVRLDKNQSFKKERERKGQLIEKKMENYYYYLFQ